jgi:hypothetical protein
MLAREINDPANTAAVMQSRFYATDHQFICLKPDNIRKLTSAIAPRRMPSRSHPAPGGVL